MTVQRISQMGNLPEHGRIRTGIKSGRAMKALDTFRFTSADREAVEQLAELYGGTVQAWNDPKANPPKQWEVVSDSSVIEVAVQPGSVFATYELWTGGGLQRQCDGESCSMWERRRDSLERSEVACVCASQGMLECKPKTRMNLIFPSINFAGTWRYESSGAHALHTLPTMLELIDQLQQANSKLMLVTLNLVPREMMKAGQKRKFTVVEVRTKVSVNDIMAGQSSYQGIEASSSKMPAIEGKTVEHEVIDDITPVDTDDEIVDAELVEEEDEPSDDSGPDPSVLPRSVAFEKVKESGGKLTASKVDGGWVVK